MKEIQTFLNAITARDFIEKPVSISQFFTDTTYLGVSTKKGKSLYEVWKRELVDIFSEDSRYLVVFTGAIGCLGPDVRVSLLDGRELTIPEIIEERQGGKQHWVYSYDIERSKIVPGKVVDALLSGREQKVVEVLLDNKKKIQCTSNHPFLLTTGEYREAQYLKPNDRLMPLYRNVPNHGREHQKKRMLEWWREVDSGTKERMAEACREAKLSKKEAIPLNHRVVSVRVCSRKLNVYDLSIEKHHNFALTSGVFVHNTGKTFTACIGVAYVMYLILLLRDPWGFHGLSESGKMSVVFFNLTKTLSSSRAYAQLQIFLTNSTWFRNRGILSKKGGSKTVGSEVNLGDLEESIQFPLFEFVHASPYAKGFGSIGGHIICALMDEMNDPSASEGSRLRTLKSYENTVRRFDSRFVKRGESLGRLFLVSSKQDEMAFLDTFIIEMKSTGRVKVVDIPIWEAKPSSYYCGEKFSVRIGDIYTPSSILEKEEVEIALKSGARVISIPIEYLEDFQRDIVGALRDFAGISIEGLRKSKLFSSEKLVLECFDETKEDPVSKLTISLGVKDEKELIHFLDLGKIRVPRSLPRHIHMDIAYAAGGDALGLAMSGVIGWTKVQRMQPDSRFVPEAAPIVETDFVMRIIAPPGDSIPLFKVRKLVLDLRRAGFNIEGFTSDLELASKDTAQVLSVAGINVDYLSVDRDRKPYMDFASVVMEKRWLCHRHPYLFFEMVNLERDPKTGKIDHPEKVADVVVLKSGEVKEVVLRGSKDLSDAVCGSVFRAIEFSKAPADAEAIAGLVRGMAQQFSSPREDLETWWHDFLVGKVPENLIPEEKKVDDTTLGTLHDILRKVRH